MESPLVLNGKSLTLEDVVSVSRGMRKAEVAEEQKATVEKCRKFVQKLDSEGEVAYGITTGCGPMCNRLLSAEDAEEFQKNRII